MAWWIKLGFFADRNAEQEAETVKRRLREQEERVLALTRAVEVIQRQLSEEEGQNVAK